MPTAQQWIDTGLVPTAGLASWHMFEAGVSGNNIIYDYSGNNRYISSSPTNSPVIVRAGPNNSYAWYFNGSTTVPLNVTVPLLVKHVFILASHDDAAFNLNRGLLTGIGGSSSDIFVSQSSGTKFFDFGYSTGFEYRKSGTFYGAAAMEAPMSGNFALLEGQAPLGVSLDGLQVGKQKAAAGRIWKGYFSEMLVYTSVLSEEEVDRIRLYFNLKFWQFKVGLPFYFPCQHIVPNASLGNGTMVNTRYASIAQDYGEITDSWEYEDKGSDYNEIAAEAPRRWEYGYQNVSKQQRVIFDMFNSAARKSNAFYFHDNDGFTWDKVRIESYSPGHDAHKRWQQNVTFQLKAETTSVSFAEDIDLPTPADTSPPGIPTGLTAVSTGTSTILLMWVASTDPGGVGGTGGADVTPPSVPAGLAAAANGMYAIDLVWSASTD